MRTEVVIALGAIALGLSLLANLALVIRAGTRAIVHAHLQARYDVCDQDRQALAARLDTIDAARRQVARHRDISTTDDGWDGSNDVFSDTSQ